MKFHKANESVTNQRATPLVPPPGGCQASKTKQTRHKREETLEIVMRG